MSLTRWIRLAKRVRARVLDGKTLHLLEPQPFQQLDTIWDGWDAIRSYHRAPDSEAVFAFRLGLVTDARVIPLHGPKADSAHRVSFEDSPDTYTVTGRDRMSRGVSLTRPGQGQAPTNDKPGMVRGSDVIFLGSVEA